MAAVSGLLLLILVAAGALLALLPALKEGFDRSDLPMLAIGIVVLAGIAWLWSRFSNRAMRLAGLAILAWPFSVYLFTGGQLVFNAWYGPHLAAQSKVDAVRATPIKWPDFDGPVGVRLEIELMHPLVPKGNLLSPKLAWSTSGLTARDYFNTLPSLSIPGFQVTPHGDAFGRPSPSRLIYDLYPSVVRTVHGSASFCLDRDFRMSSTGGRLTANWYFAGSSQLEVDLGQYLTQSLRSTPIGSMSEGEWNAMFRRFDPSGLSRIGYHPCQDANASSLEACYCR
jgi:hypothetical protein